MVTKKKQDKQSLIEDVILFTLFLTQVFTSLTMLLIWHKFGLATDLIDLIKILLR